MRKPQENEKQLYKLKIDSVIFSSSTNEMSIFGNLINLSNYKVYFPIIENYPIISSKSSLAKIEGVDSLMMCGLKINWFKNGKQVHPKDHVTPEGFPAYFSDSIDTMVYSKSRGKWDAKSLKEMLKRNNPKQMYKTTYNWFYQNQFLKNSNLILNPKQKKKIQILIDKNSFQEEFYNKYQFKVLPFLSEIDSISLAIISDSIILKDSIFSTKEFENFRANDVRIFDSIIKSKPQKVIRKQ